MNLEQIVESCVEYRKKRLPDDLVFDRKVLMLNRQDIITRGIGDFSKECEDFFEVDKQTIISTMGRLIVEIPGLKKIRGIAGVDFSNVKGRLTFRPFSDGIIMFLGFVLIKEIKIGN